MADRKKAIRNLEATTVEFPATAKRRTVRRPVTELAAHLTASSAPTATFDLTGDRFEAVNARCLDLLGLDEIGMSALRLADLAPLAERVALMEALRVVGRWEGEWTYRPAGSRPIWLQVVVSVARRDEKGEPTHAVAVMLDVSRQARVLERLRAREALSLQSQLAGGLALFSGDLGTEILASGPSGLALLGLSTGEKEVSLLDALSRVFPADATRLRELIEETLARRGKELRAEFRVWRASDGQWRDIELRLGYEYDEAGRPLRSLGAAIDVTERKQAQQRLARGAKPNPLARLCNRQAFHERLAEACAYANPGDPIAVLRLELHRGRVPGQVYSRAFDDLLLVHIWRRLRGQLRGADKIARLGDDSFAILHTGLREPEDAGLVSRRLVARLHEPFLIEGRRADVGASIGVAVAPHDGLRAEDLMRSAELALAEAKAQPHRGWRYFDTQMNAQALARHQFDSDLRRAIEAQEFELYYQPMLGLHGRGVMKFEALIRWRHPLKGLIPPDGFIPDCERNGMICEIGDWVLRQACADAAKWPQDIGVAVNVSAVQVARGDLHQSVAAALEASGLKAHRLEVEITETSLLHNTEATLSSLRKVKAMGVRIAMDDFGVGYASLGYLQSFPFDKVKIDRSFTREVAASAQGAARLKAILDLCAAFDMSTIIEGVETQGQLEALARLGGTKFQGFLFSPPRPADCVQGLIEKFADADALPAET